MREGYCVLTLHLKKGFQHVKIQIRAFVFTEVCKYACYTGIYIYQCQLFCPFFNIMLNFLWLSNLNKSWYYHTEHQSMYAQITLWSGSCENIRMMHTFNQGHLYVICAVKTAYAILKQNFFLSFRFPILLRK